MTDNVLRLSAYHLRSDSSDRSPEFQAIEFGDDWVDELKSLRTRLWKRDGGHDNLPIRALNQLFESVSPGVIAARNAQSAEDGVWLYAQLQIPEDVLWAAINGWVHGWKGWNSTPEDDADITETLQNLRRTPLRWEARQVDLSEHTVSDGGTGQPHPRLYRLLPEYLAARLSAHPYTFDGDGIVMRTVGGGTKTELVSWPPQSYRAGGRVWRYSLRVRISLQTVPFAPEPRIHVATGIRRWMTGESLWLKHHRATAVVDAALDWLRFPGDSYRLITGVVERDRGGRDHHWSRNSLPVLLPAYSESCPPAGDLMRDPDQWSDADRCAFVVYHTGHKYRHKVGPGILPKERRLVDEWARDSLSEWLVRVPDLVPALGRRSLRMPRPPSNDDQSAARQRRAAIACATGGVLRVELLYQESAMRRLIIEQLCVLLDLGVPLVVGDEYEWRTDGLRIELITRQTGAELSPLPVHGRTRKERSDSRSQEVKKRRGEVAASFRSLDGAWPPPVVLVELMGQDKFNAFHDPKFAIRLGCARAGRLSQFIRPVSESADNAEHRAQSALLDGFRQLGATPVPDHTLGKLLTADLDYLAIHVLRKRRNRAGGGRASALVAVRVRHAGDGYAIEGWSTLHPEWCPYPQLLLELAAGAEIPGDPTVPTPLDRWRSREDEQRDSEAQTTVILDNMRNRPTLLVVDAHNLRLAWAWLQHGNIALDRLGFGERPPQRIDLFGPGLRLAVIRGEDDEVPEWYWPRVKKAEVTAGHRQGLWEPANMGPDNRVFVSAGEVPAQGGRKRDLLKITPQAARPKAPEVPGWNPRYLEIAIAGCLSPEVLAATGRTDVPPDDPRALAALVHQLRNSDDYAGPLAVPLPNHLAKLAGEYVVPSLADDELADDEIEDEDQPGGSADEYTTP